MLFQADVETDEVYAQMTLQPLTPVRSIAFFFSSIYFLGFIFMFSFSFPHLYFHTGRAEGYISSNGVGNSKQAANQLFLQDTDSK